MRGADVESSVRLTVKRRLSDLAGNPLGIEGMFGLVPSFFHTVPDASLELEWQLFKRIQSDTGPIPNKHRELIGIAIAAVTKCRYCITYHTGIARLNGASAAEIEDAVHFAKSSMGWSTYLNGMQVDYEQFRQELSRACEHVRNTAATKAAA